MQNRLQAWDPTGAASSIDCLSLTTVASLAGIGAPSIWAVRLIRVRSTSLSFKRHPDHVCAAAAAMAARASLVGCGRAAARVLCRRAHLRPLRRAIRAALGARRAHSPVSLGFVRSRRFTGAHFAVYMERATARMLSREFMKAAAASVQLHAQRAARDLHLRLFSFAANCLVRCCRFDLRLRAGTIASVTLCWSIQT